MMLLLVYYRLRRAVRRCGARMLRHIMPYTKEVPRAAMSHAIYPWRHLLNIRANAIRRHKRAIGEAGMMTAEL
jgi:hypothetical protein